MKISRRNIPDADIYASRFKEHLTTCIDFIPDDIMMVYNFIPKTNEVIHNT